MFCKISMLSHGKHNNLHMSIKIGRSKANPIFYLRMVLFFDYQLVCISHSNIHKDFIPLLNYSELERIINAKLSKLDVKLFLSSYDDFYHRNIKSEFLLKKLKDENKCVVSISRSKG